VDVDGGHSRGLPIGCRVMPAYVIANVMNAWDQEKLVEYRERNTDVVAAHGGRFVVRGGRVERLEGDWDPQRVVVMEFADVAAARAWHDAPEYQPLRALRSGVSSTDLILVEGADG
jgi:uncharacterized protein (DUF1330 family)